MSFVATDRANAATVDTFNFTQNVAGEPLYGTFTGTVESSGPLEGYIEQSDLTSITIYFGSPAFYYAPTVYDLSFNVENFLSTGSTTTFDLYAPLLNFLHNLEAYACVGAYAGSGYCGIPGAGANEVVGLPGDTIVYFTADFPTITLVSSVTTTPLPAALPLFATGLGGLGLLGWRRKRANTSALAA
jgi:hypothetical protein